MYEFIYVHVPKSQKTWEFSEGFFALTQETCSRASHT